MKVNSLSNKQFQNPGQRSNFIILVNQRIGVGAFYIDCTIKDFMTFTQEVLPYGERKKTP